MPAAVLLDDRHRLPATSDYTFDTTPWPTHVTLDNFATALSTQLGNHLGQALLNSLFIGACVTIVALVVGIFAAYALARLKFRGKCLVVGLDPRRLDVPRASRC